MASKMLVVFALFYFIIITEVSVIKAKYVNQNHINSRGRDNSRIVFPDDVITTIHAPVVVSEGLEDRYLVNVQKCASGLVRIGLTCEVPRKNVKIRKPKKPIGRKIHWSEISVIRAMRSNQDIQSYGQRIVFPDQYQSATQSSVGTNMVEIEDRSAFWTRKCAKGEVRRGPVCRKPPPNIVVEYL